METTPAKYDWVEGFTRDVLKAQFGREMVSMAPLDGGKNTLVYELSIGPATNTPDDAPSTSPQPGTSSLPLESVDLVMRFSNVESMLNEEIRVQSEVATMQLMREALSHLETRLVPAVYGWSPTVDGRGWMLMERMPGSSLAKSFPSLATEDQRKVLGQMARVFAAIQKYKLPASVQGFGGLNFDKDGNVVVGPTPIAGGGPCETLQGLYTEYFQTQLAFADKCDIVKGWKDTDLRSRIDKFATEKLPELLRSLPLVPRQTLVHADFDTNNLLFDSKTNNLTALLDFDFSHVASQADEYLYSFNSQNYIILPAHIDEPGLAEVRKSLLNGFSDDAASRESETVDWKVAVMFDQELHKAGVERPQDIPGVAELSTLYWFIQDVSPPVFFLKRWRARVKPERAEMMRQSTKGQLEWTLDRWGC